MRLASFRAAIPKDRLSRISERGSVPRYVEQQSWNFLTQLSRGQKATDNSTRSKAGTIEASGKLQDYLRGRCEPDLRTSKLAASNTIELHCPRRRSRGPSAEICCPGRRSG